MIEFLCRKYKEIHRQTIIRKECSKIVLTVFQLTKKIQFKDIIYNSNKNGKISRNKSHQRFIRHVWENL